MFIKMGWIGMAHNLTERVGAYIIARDEMIVVPLGVSFLFRRED